MEIWSSRYDTNNFSSPREIFLNSCGLQIFDNRPFGIIRKNGRLDYHILIIKYGHCMVDLEGEKHNIGENDIIIYEPNQKQEYYFLDKHSESYWLHFSGTRTKSLLDICHLKNGIYHIRNVNEIYLILEHMIRAYNKKNVLGERKEIKCASILIELICQLSEDINDEYAYHSISDELMNYIHHNYTSNISFDEFSQNHGISAHRLTQIFKEQTGLTPHKYKLNLQLIDAKWLLKNSELNISEIANKIGFSDPLYFSRVFKKYTGFSPKEFTEQTSSKT